MKDFLAKYKNRKIIGNIYIALASLGMAFIINILFIDGTNFEKNLRTSILDSGVVTEAKADIFLGIDGEKVILKNSKEMQNVENISFSIVYDNSNLEISEIKSSLGEVKILGEKGSGIETILINPNGKNIEKNKNLVELIFSKKEPESSTQINLFNSNFTDSSGTIFSLTTSGLSL
ncbi:hypothetical protein HXK64_01380 [Candidatus Gracilibacteria bacterium]|nr:hypothetical protein [Candidatus Gracilibacteria bacterium]